ncbi:unnamed protein product [Protopolystoma xenopodis]|uniref:Uncharacterized protein n=1 Tax=Protopolystoma xenopodis TaxID=117903 RepID=A0A448WYH0_9PLAT|nr:unnamed protein product [Protopolystoma xenopodis]
MQISFDASRNLIYTRSANSQLTVYRCASSAILEDASSKITNSDSNLIRLTTMNQSELANAASSVAPSIDKKRFKNIVYITPVHSDPIHLLVVLQTGIRLYLGAQLHLLHVRLPPSPRAVVPPFLRLGTIETPSNLPLSFGTVEYV